MLKNIVANIIGKFWSILSNYLFIPLYIHLLGIENYAVISFSFIIIGVMSVMDAGLTATLSREFAKKDRDAKSDHKMRVLNTLEYCYWIIACVIIFIILLFADTITEKWMTLRTLPVPYVINAIKIFGFGMALQLLGNFYIGGLIGLERQVKANVYQVIWGILRNGCVALIIVFKPTLIWFFSWQAGVTLIYVITLRIILVKLIKKDSSVITKGKFLFDRLLLKDIGKFVGGMFLISLVAAVNTQLDKIAISKMLPIEELGYYNLGTSLTQVLLVLVTPISIALLPRFTSLYSLREDQKADELFSTVLQIVSIIIFSIAAIIMFNSMDIIKAWTANSTLALATSKYVIYLALGTAMLSIQVIPFNIAIANGYTKINNVLGILSLFISIPGYWISVHYMGPKGAAITWCVIQTVIAPIYLYYIHKVFIKTHTYYFLLIKQIVKPAITAVVIAFLFSLLSPHLDSRILQLIVIGLFLLITITLVCLINIPISRLKNYRTLIMQKLSVVIK